MTNNSLSSNAQTIFDVSKQFLIYSSYMIISLGLIGNVLNIICLSSLKIFRGNRCVFYILIESFVDCGTLLMEFLTRIDLSVYNYDLTNLSLFWCKLRPMFLQMCMMISLTTVCFSTFDQYLSTNHSYRLRQMSTLKLAQRLTVLNICFWTIHSIPFGFFYEIQPVLGCTISNQVFKLYYTIVYLSILNGVIPLFTSIVFSILSFNNVRRIIRRQIPILRRKLDRQLTAMVLARVAFLFIVSIPFGLFYIYTLNTSSNDNDSTLVAIEQLITYIISTLYYINYAGAFYLYCFASTRFRRQVYYVLGKKICRKICNRNVLAHNQVAPLTSDSSIN